MKKQYLLFILAVTCGLSGLLPFTHAQSETTTTSTISDAAIQGAILCWNEAGGNRFDCSAIIETRMRSARHHGRTFAEELYALHGDGRERHPERAALRSDRATNPQRHDARPWLGDIQRDLHQPLHWPESQVSWTTYAERFQVMFRFVQDVLDGNEHSRCRGYPTTWGGPRVDAHTIRRHLAAGREVVDCGATHNVFLGRTP